MFETLDAAGCPRCLIISHPQSGLRAVIALHDTTLGPAAGGVRTRAYLSIEAAVREAAALAEAMTVKCALGGLAAGGGKAVVLDHPGLKRNEAFEQLGREVEALGGLFRTGADLGTNAQDTAAMARHTRYVHTDERSLAASVGRGMLACVRACAEVNGRPSVVGLRVAVQGAGVIGAAVSSALSDAGADITISDIDRARADSVAARCGGRVVAPEHLLAADVDVLAPCALGGVLTAQIAAEIRAWAVCGAANNILADREAARVLWERGVLHVPDPIASAGAVVDGIGDTVMGIGDRAAMIDALGETAKQVLSTASSSDALPIDVAAKIARARIELGR